MSSQVMSNHIEAFVDVVGTITTGYCGKLAQIHAGTPFGDFMTCLSITSAIMVIIVNADKFIEKVKKYSSMMVRFIAKHKERTKHWKWNLIWPIVIGFVIVCIAIFFMWKMITV